MKIILHVGTMKTGSTSIQETLALNKNNLLKNKILYPSFGKSMNHDYLATSLCGFENLDIRGRLKFKNSRSLYNKYLETKWRDLKREIQKTRPDTVILSSENIFNIVNTGDLKKFKSQLAELSNNITVIVYIRRPSDFYLSNVQQTIKFYSNFDYPKPYSIKETLDNLNNSFDDLKVFAYEYSHFQGDDVVSDFSNRVIPGITLKKLQINKNTSLSSESMDIVTQYRRKNHLDKEGILLQDTKMLVKLLKQIDSQISANNRPQLKDDIKDFIDSSSIDLLWLRNQHQIQFDGIKYDSIASKIRNPFESSANISDICLVNAEVQAQIYSSLLFKIMNNKTNWIKHLKRFF